MLLVIPAPAPVAAAAPPDCRFFRAASEFIRRCEGVCKIHVLPRQPCCF